MKHFVCNVYSDSNKLSSLSLSDCTKNFNNSRWKCPQSECSSQNIMVITPTLALILTIIILNTGRYVLKKLVRSTFIQFNQQIHSTASWTYSVNPLQFTAVDQKHREHRRDNYTVPQHKVYHSIHLDAYTIERETHAPASWCHQDESAMDSITGLFQTSNQRPAHSRACQR